MCGRFALITPPVRLARYFQAVLDDVVEPERAPSYNVAPTDPVVGITARTDPETGEISRLLRGYRWGLIPSWAKDASSGSRLFNARSESVATKASFRTAFKSHRILIPADGFYEWRTVKAGSKQPHFFTAPTVNRWPSPGCPNGGGTGARPMPRRSGRAPSSRPQPVRTWTGSTTACP
jgi:putative SOS response-associated peptidase YedK